LFKISPDEKNKINLLRSEARVGNIETAKRLNDELAATDKTNPDLHLERACALAQLTRKSEGAEQQAAFLEAALTALERAIADGYSDPFRIQAEQDLDPLHETERFKRVISKLEADRKQSAE
jgi:hypothetical protein